MSQTPQHSAAPANSELPVALGDSGIQVAPLGWGMWRFAGATRVEALRRIEAALDAGCTLFDTADVYGYGGAGFGGAESLLGEVLREQPAIRARIVLATKAGVVPPTPYDSSARHLIGACEASLRRLGVGCIDLFQVHRPDLLAHPAEVAAALARLRDSGKIRAAGVSNYSAAQIDALQAHLPFRLASSQPQFSPLSIEPLSDGVLDAAMRLGHAVLAWSPLAQGLLGGDVTADGAAPRAAAVIRVLDEFAAEAGVAREAVAYAWIMAHPARPIPLIGSQNPARIRAATAAQRVRRTGAPGSPTRPAGGGAPLP